MSQLPQEGFIDHYVTGVVYPTGAAGIILFGVFAAVPVSWILCVADAAKRSSVRS